MKRQIIIGAIAIILTMSLIRVMVEVWPRTCENRILDTATDERGLTSVIFVQDGKEWGLDYLTPHELDSLKNVLNK